MGIQNAARKILWEAVCSAECEQGVYERYEENFYIWTDVHRIALTLWIALNLSLVDNERVKNEELDRVFSSSNLHCLTRFYTRSV